MDRTIVKITLEDLKQGVEVNVCQDDTKITFVFDNDSIMELLKEKFDTIPGHPNCKYGECYDCHVVSCGIHQGYEEIPTRASYCTIVLKLKE